MESFFLKTYAVARCGHTQCTAMWLHSVIALRLWSMSFFSAVGRVILTAQCCQWDLLKCSANIIIRLRGFGSAGLYWAGRWWEFDGVLWLAAQPSAERSLIRRKNRFSNQPCAPCLILVTGPGGRVTNGRTVLRRKLRHTLGVIK